MPTADRGKPGTAAGHPEPDHCEYCREMTETSFTADTDAGPIAGHVSGAAPALLLLHGGPAITDYLQILGPEVAGWRAIRYQQRCLRPSSIDGPFTVERHVADAVAVLDALGVDRPWWPATRGAATWPCSWPSLIPAG